MGLQVCSGLQEMHLVHFLGVLLDRLLGHFLFTILAIGCVVAGVVYISFRSSR